MMSNGTVKPLSKAKAKELNGFVEQLMQLAVKEYVTAADYMGHHRDMYGLLERIRRLEPKLRTSNGLPRTDNVDTFTKWATANGCALNRVRIAEQFGGLGLEATESIPGGECCIEVPRSLFFYVQNGPQFRKLLELMPPAMLREHGNIVLALALIMERFRKDSFWKPYFDVLPERYTTPLYFTPEDMVELRNTEAFLPALKLCKSIARQYGFIRKFVQDKVDELQHNFSYNVFRWAVSTVMTRQNKVPVNLAGFEGLDSTLALIPYWDMANHDHPERHEAEPVGSRLIAETVYNAGNERLECHVVKEEVHPNDWAGTPIFITYGKRTDAEFLVHNGFVVRGNPHTRVTKSFKLNPEDRLCKQRSHLLKLKDMPTEGKFAFGNYNREPSVPPGLIALACVSAMDETDLNSYTAQGPEWLDDISGMPTNLADRTELLLGEWLTKLLRVYPTTAEEDEALLEDSRQLNPTRRLVIQYRLEEKRVLQGYIHNSRLRPLLNLAKLSIATVSEGK